uniref:Uncharacterized protein n=1 Tax=Sphaerodactylus townsendi TaxID=933632 RepID=A0ACB8E5T9_9SAUR
MGARAVKTIVFVRRDTREHTVDNLSVKVDALMVEDVWPQTDVPAPMASLDLSVKGLEEGQEGGWAGKFSSPGKKCLLLVRSLVRIQPNVRLRGQIFQR